MLRRFASVAFLCLVDITGGLTCAAEAAKPHYHLTRRITGPDGLWDYASVDGQTRQLFVGRQGGILSLDLDDPGASPRAAFNAPVIHQILPIGSDRLLATTGEGNVLAILRNGAPMSVARVPVSGRDVDSVAYDQKTGLAVTFNRGSKDATIIDVSSEKRIGSVPLPGRPESSVSDNAGAVYVNITEPAEIAVIDLRQQKIVKTINLTGCEEPTGLAVDLQTQLLIAACDNGVAKVVTTGGLDRGTLTIGQGPDAAFIDSIRRLLFIPCGDSGTLAVFSLTEEGKIELTETVKTQRGARTGAVDPKTGRVYLPTGKLIPPVAPAKWPSVVPGTFEILEISP